MTGSTLRRRLAVAAVGVGVAVVPLGGLGATAAHAADAEACVYNGTTTQLTPIPVTGQSAGTFAFSGAGTCAGQAGTGAVTIVANGAFTNLQCGTGTATGTAQIAGALNRQYTFSITFAGGQGTLTVQGGGSTGAGTVHIVPNTGGCVTGPATSFSVAGDLAGML